MRITEEHVRKFNRILDLLEEAYKAYFSVESHCKSSDGYAALTFPPYFWREEEGTQPGVEIYSYVLGPDRMHYFDTLDEALMEVEAWHEEMLSMVSPCSDCGKNYWECGCEEEIMTKRVVWDTETSGVDVLNDRIVQLVIGVYDSETGKCEEFHEWIINPGVEIPEEAAEVHGFTTEKLQEIGQDPKEALSEAIEIFRKHHKELHIAYNAKFDVSILDAEFKRHGVSDRWGKAMESVVPLYDPYVVDRAQDKYRKGKRKLMNVADHFKIEYDEDELHNAKADVDLAYKVSEACIAKYGLYSTRDQARFYREWAKGFREYLARQGKEPDDLTDDWPLQKGEK